MSMYMGDQPVQGIIGLAVTPGSLIITPGQPANLQIVLTNTGTTRDGVMISVEGVPAEWVQGATQEVILYPGMREAATLLINVERKPTNRAGTYHVILRAHSRAHPRDYSQVHLSWSVQPFQETLLQLEPHKASGHGQALYLIGLENWSNQAQRYVFSLSKNDDEQQLAHQFHSNPVDLDAGQQTRVPLRVQGKRHLLGQEQRILFQLHVGLTESPPAQHSSAEFINKPLLSTWLVSAMMALLALSGLGLSSLLGLFPPHSASGGTVSPTSVASPTTTAIPEPAGTITASLTPTVTASPTPTATASPKTSPSPAGPPVGTRPPAISHVTSLASNLGGAIGSQYVASQDSLYFVEEFTGNLSVLRQVSSAQPQYQMLGTGYIDALDISITADGSTAYIDEDHGDLLAVNLKGNTNASAARVITSSLLTPEQMAVDEAHHIAYVIESGIPGSLVSVDLNVGTVTPILTTLNNPIGLVLSPDGTSVYITENPNQGGTGQLSRYSLLTPGGNQLVLATTATANLWFLSWADASEDALLVPERFPANKIWYFSLAKPGLQLLANVPVSPSSAVRASSSAALPILVCADSAIEKLS